MASNEIASSNPMKKSGDLYTCGVCLLTFDKVVQMPKFLSCAHTFCLSCLTRIYELGTSRLRCPYCRKCTEIEAGMVNTLPNNPYVLDWLNSCPKKNPLWCLECGKPATKFCRLMPGSSHPTVLKDAAPKDCRDLQKIRRANDDQLESIIQKLKDREFSLEKLSAVLKDLQDENHVALNRVSQIKESELKVNPDDSIKSLRLKSEETSVDIQEEVEDFQQKKDNVMDLTKAVESLQLEMKTVTTDKFLMK